VLDEAARLVAGPRNETHGDYTHEAQRIGRLWGGLLNLPEPVPPRTVAAMMIALKLARATAGAVNVDDWVDAAGYAALGAQIDVDLGTARA
jgi:transposase InsO family protein